jgi:hypothetical protein
MSDFSLRLVHLRKKEKAQQRTQKGSIDHGLAADTIAGYLKFSSSQIGLSFQSRLQQQLEGCGS